MKRILVIAPHPDDEIIGVGGTMIKEIKAGNEVYVCVVTKGCEPLFSKESVEKVRRESLDCHSKIGVKNTFFFDFPAAMLETVNRYELNEKFIETLKEVNPEEVYIPHVGDMQKDHQLVVDASMVAMRPKYGFAPRKIFSYETLSETGWNVPSVQNEFIPNAFVDISDTLSEKLVAMSVYTTQTATFPDARSLEALEALAKYRGALMNIHAAEAFMLIREIN